MNRDLLEFIILGILSVNSLVISYVVHHLRKRIEKLEANKLSTPNNQQKGGM